MARTYKSQIMSWPWDGIVRSALDDAKLHLANALRQGCVDGCDAGGHIGSVFLGTVYGLSPSGKFYMPWTSNQTARDVDRDSRWYAALDEVAARHGGSIGSGDNAPDDLYFEAYFPNADLYDLA